MRCQRISRSNMIYILYSRAKGALQIPTDRTWRSSKPPVAVAYALPRLLGLEMWLLGSEIQIDGEDDSRI